MAPEDTKTASTAETASTAGPPAEDELTVALPAAAAAEERDLIGEVATQGVKGDPDRAKAALDWFLEAEPEDEADDVVYPLEINISTDPKVERYITWTVKPMASTRIDELRRAFTMQTPRKRRRAEGDSQVDIARFNAALVFEATVSPDLKEAARRKNNADGASLVLWRFRKKPLLVDQIAGQVLQYSGADEDDLREAREVIAAKN
jgi:hypothetical protein